MSTETDPPLSAKEKLKKAVKDYGSTVIIFHVSISLLSLGGCYLLVSRYVVLSCKCMSKIIFHTDNNNQYLYQQ